MATRTISIQVNNLKEVTDFLKKTGGRLTNPKVAMDIVGAKGFKDVMQHFRDEAGPSRKWTPLKRQRKRGGSKVLQDTGRLRQSTRFKTVGNVANIFNNVKYAGIHNFGGKKIPQRKFMWISKGAVTSMIKTLARFITTGKA